MIHGWSALGGLTMTEWENELERWLKPFLDRLGHKTRQRMCPLYVAGSVPAIVKAFSRWRNALQQATTINCTISSPMVSGTRHHWSLNCSITPIGLSAATS